MDDESLINAWEFGEEKSYIPIKYKYGKPDTNTIASLERMGKLSKHIKKYLAEMASQLRHGSISADPYYRNQQENACLNCDYFNICHFSDGENGESCRPKNGESCRIKNKNFTNKDVFCLTYR